MKKVTDGGKRSKARNGVKPVENMNEDSLDKLQDHADE